MVRGANVFQPAHGESETNALVDPAHGTKPRADAFLQQSTCVGVVWVFIGPSRAVAGH